MPDMLKKATLVLAIFTSISSMFMVCFVCYTHWPDKDSSLPAWVQAVGAVVAIVAAFVVMLMQTAQQRKAETRQYLERQINLTLAGIYFAERLLRALDGLKKHSTPPTTDRVILEFLNSKFNGLTRTIDNVPTWEASAAVASHLARLQHICHSCCALIDSLQVRDAKSTVDFQSSLIEWESAVSEREGSLKQLHIDLEVERKKLQ
jgi:uncharacterized membrane protein